MADTINNNEENTNANQITVGKTYSEDYVTNLRQESAGYRTKAKAHEITIESLRKAFGIAEGEDIGDISERLSSFQAVETEKVNARIIDVELKSLEGFDHKLLAKIIDLKDVKVDGNGVVTGLREAAEAIAKEFPAVRKKTRIPLIPPNLVEDQSIPNVNKEINDIIRGGR